MNEARQRASFVKSQRGCDSCKRRHQKCDETFPTCSRCARRGTQCRWELVPKHSSGKVNSDFKVLTPTTLRIAALEDNHDVFGFEYFHLNTLGTLRACQPSQLWIRAMGFFGQRSSVFRTIAIALGYQHRLLTTDPGDASIQLLTRHANRSYCKALRSLRQSINARFAGDNVDMVLACTLMVLLESSRGSPSNMLPHLKCGVDLLSGMHATIGTTVEVQTLAASLQSLCVNSSLFCLSLGYSGDFTVALDGIRVHWPEHGVARTLDSYSFGLSSIIMETIRTGKEIGARGLTDSELAEDSALQKCFLCLQDRRERLENSVMRDQSQYESDARWACLLAESKLCYIALSRRLAPSMGAAEDYTESYRVVVDFIEKALCHQASVPSSYPIACSQLSIGLGVIYGLDIVITQCSDETIRQRAFDLLDLCPQREGMWCAAETKKMMRQFV